MQYTVKREVYEGRKIERIVIKELEDWQGIEFQSSSHATAEFLIFAKMFRTRMKKEANKNGLNLVKWSNGHFYCSAFFCNRVTGKLVYTCISDVRFFRCGWLSDILVRTAITDTDYTGGDNCSAALKNVGEIMARLSA